MRHLRDSATPGLDGESAATQAIAVIVAGVVFLAVLGMALWTAQPAGRDASAVDEPNLKAESEGLAQILVASPGMGWDDGADHVTRLGLADSDGGLSLDKMDALRGAGYESASNDLLDYDDTIASLGLDGNLSGADFHLRIYPIGLESALAEADLTGMRTAYIGDWSSLASATVGLDTDQMTMVHSANDALNATIVASTTTERQMLDELGLGFNNRIHMGVGSPDVKVQIALGVKVPITTLVTSDLLEGDVYPDIKGYIDLVMATRLDEYDLLIVGSGVQQNSLTTNAVKNAIRDWVMDGGNLMVLGSDSQNFQWLQPLFSVGTSTVNGQAYAPDVSHPMLIEPHDLDWTHYDNHGISWDIKDQGSNAHYEDFEHIILESGEDLLAVSLDGAFGEGRIFLTAYQPREVAQQLGFGEGQDLLHNMIVYADRSYLYLDYGPPVPADTSVGAAVRTSHVTDPDLGEVPVRVELLMWRS